LAVGAPVPDVVYSSKSVPDAKAVINAVGVPIAIRRPR
jgi:hypothetical protein